MQTKIRMLPKPKGLFKRQILEAFEVSFAKKIAGLDRRDITDPDNQYLPRKEAAQMLGQKPQTLAVWATTKRYDLPYRRIGHQAYYKVSDLLRLLEKGTK